MNRTAELFNKLGEYFAAGFFEDENAPYNARTATAIVRHFEHAPAPEFKGYCGLQGYQALWCMNHYKIVNYQYNFGFALNRAALDKAVQDMTPFDRTLLERAFNELSFCIMRLVPQRYSIGGNGWIHCVPNYERVLEEGLVGYKERLDAKPDNDFYRPLKQVMDALIAFFNRCPGLLGRVPNHPAKTFQEALVSIAAIWYLDGCDSFGRLDNILGKYYHGEPEAYDALREFWTQTDINTAWHMYLADKPEHHDFTMLCIKAQNGIRRPNTGIRIDENTSDETWQTIFDSWEAHNPTPSLYNDAIYKETLPQFTDVRPEDLEHYAMGGCTETMFEGRSQVGSIDAGLNLLEIYRNSDSYESFKAAVKYHVKAACEAVVLNHEFAAKYNPAIIRTLFVDDCIDKGRDFRDCGARYNGSVINLAGATDTINAIAADRGIKGMFGNDNPEVNAIAHELYDFVFKEITSQRTYGWCLPSVILLTTYAAFGTYVPASAGRPADGAPLADSSGAYQGTDAKGPTSLINSVLSIPPKHGIGTLIFNLRLNVEMLKTPEKRAIVKSLITSFFKRGGMQIQVTIVDQETLRKAYEKPEDYPNLMVRIGGYSEYYTRLSRTLQAEILKRTEHCC